MFGRLLEAEVLGGDGLGDRTAEQGADEATGAAFDLEPDWPRRLSEHLGVARPGANERALGSTPAIGRVTLAVLAVLAAAQVALPLRHYVADGNVRWNEDGYYLSWRVMLPHRW